MDEYPAASINLPSQTGQSGNFLQTNGSVLLWAPGGASGSLSTTGGTMTGAIAMSGNKIISLGNPTNPQDAATDAWVTANFSPLAGSSFLTTVASNLSLGGNPTTSTQSPSDNSTKIATTAFVTTLVLNASSGAAPFLVSVRTVTATTTNTATDFLIRMNASGSQTINLLASSGSTAGQVLQCKNIGSGTCTVQANGSENIDNANTFTLSQYQNLTICNNGAGWDIL